VIVAGSTRGLNWAYVLTGVAEATLLPYIPLYLFQHGLTPPEIGAVLAVAAAASLVAGMAWAYLADRSVSPERAVVGGTVAAAAVVVLVLPFAHGAVGLGAVLAVLLVARAPFTLLDPIALQRLRAENRTRYARIRLRMSAGWTLSAVVSGGVYQVFGLRLLPFVYAPTVVLFGLWVWYSVQPAARSRASEAAPSATPRLGVLSGAMAGFLLACFLLGASAAAAQNFVTIQINVLGGGALVIGAAAAFQSLTEIPTMGSVPLLTQRLSHKTLFAVGCAVYALVFFLWAVVSDPVALSVLKLAAGVAFALTFVFAVLIADHLTPAHLRATGQAMVKAVLFGLAPIAGSYEGGVVYGGLGARAMFLAATAVMVAAGAVALIVIPANIRREGAVEQPKPVTAPVRA